MSEQRQQMTPERWQRVEALFNRALAQPPPARAAFLEDACRDDVPLRHEVESLLAESLSDAGVLATAAAPAMIGRTLGGYRLETLLGVGGMGEVYRARDAKLGRDVAIKILPGAVTRDPDRLARFEREARMLAALNHPNVCAIYGLEEADAVRFLVLELVDGETLAHKLNAAVGLAWPEALGIARQICDALEAAHEKGIVHRDLKPANVTITHGGIVKVLDFGLAKPVGPDGVGVDMTQSPTITQHGADRPGVILGTAAYMSPEQARGKAIDKRTDIWAFGCVLYEMVTGRLAFVGETVSDTIGKILEREPDWSALPASTPPPIRRLLRLCLEKDPRRRLRDIGDVRIEIEAVDDIGQDSLAASAAAVRTAWVPWLAVATLAIALATVVVWTLARPATPLSAVTRFTIIPPDAPPFAGTGHMVALSPDGTQIAYVSTNQLFVRSLSQHAARALQSGPGSQPTTEPVFSPDGRSIAFFTSTDRTIKRISVTDGTVVTVAPAETPSGITWGADGIVYGQGNKGVLRVSPEPGSTPETLVRVKVDESAFGPQLLPDGTHILFTLASGTSRDRWDNAQIVVQSLKTGDRKTLITHGSDARYLPTGHLVYGVSGIVYAIAFDRERLEVKGDPVPVLEGVSRSAVAVTGAVNYAFSGSGTLAYIPGPVSSSLVNLALTDRSGGVESLSAVPGAYQFPRVSPDGTHVAFGIDDGKEAIIYVRDVSREGATDRLTYGGNNRYPVWTSKNGRVAFQSDREGDLAIWRAADGSGRAERLTRPNPGELHEPLSWSGASDTLVFSVTKGSDMSLWTYSFATRKSAPLGAVHSSAFNATDAVFSPDGRWVAYSSNESGKWTIWFEPFPATGERHQLIAKGNDDPHQPLWSPDGKEVFYVPRPGSFESVPVALQPFTIGNPRRLSWWAAPGSRPFFLGPPRTRRSFDLLPDGRFLGVIIGAGGQTGAGPDPHIEVVLNWFEELKAITARGSTGR